MLQYEGFVFQSSWCSPVDVLCYIRRTVLAERAEGLVQRHGILGEAQTTLGRSFDQILHHCRGGT